MHGVKYLEPPKKVVVPVVIRKGDTPQKLIPVKISPGKTTPVT